MVYSVRAWKGLRRAAIDVLTAHGPSEGRAGCDIFNVLGQRPEG